MAIDGVGPRASFLGTQILNLRTQFDDLQRQLTTGKKSDTYAGMGLDRGVAIGLRAQISQFDGFTSTMTNINARLDIADTALQGITKIVGQVRAAATSSSLDVTSNGQTQSQALAKNQLGQFLQLLNTQAGDRFLFSGRAIDVPATAALDDILNGVGVQAGLKQLIAERNQADLGSILPAPPTGRLILTPAGTTITIAEDVAGSPFGLKLASIASSAPAGVAVVPPAGVPPTESLDVVGPPNPGDTLTFNFRLPDQTIETIQLTATDTLPLTKGQYLIDPGGVAANTAANINTVLTTALDALIRGPLVAASAVQASREFFTGDANGRPLRVVGPPPFTASTALVPGITSGPGANTVEWYTGESAPPPPAVDPARGTATALVDQGLSVQYGARAEEQAFTLQLQNLAVFATLTTSQNNPNANALIAGLYQRVAQNAVPQAGQQSLQEVQEDFAGAQIAMQAATDRQAQTKNTALGMLNSIEGVSKEAVATELLAVQNSLDASFQTTSMLFKLSLLNYL